MIEDKIKAEVALLFQTKYSVNVAESDIDVTKPARREMGDFSTNIAFKMAKQIGRPPKDIAEEVQKDFEAKHWNVGLVNSIKAANGYINFFLDHSYFQGIVSDILEQKSSYANLELFKGKKVQVEFISSNPTGPPTLANGRGGYGGDVLSNVFAKAGAKVEREFYINDYGNQVRILGDSVLIAAKLKEATDDYYRGEYIDNWVKENRDFIDKNKNEAFVIGYECAQYVLDSYIKPAVSAMKIKFDRYYSEKNLYDKRLVEAAVDFLDSKDLTYEADGAKWLKTTKFGDDKDRVLIKSNGDYTYMTPDVAYHWEKFGKRNYDMVIDILGADHHGYTSRMQAAVGALGYGNQLHYLLTQMVRLVKDGKEFKMSKRKGVVVTMSDLFELIGGSVSEASDVARFFFLMRSFNTHMDFDLDLAKERSDKNPVFYVKYAYARISSILAKSPSSSLNKVKDLEILRQAQNDNIRADLSLLVAPEETELIEQMAQLPQVVASIVSFDDYPVHYLTYYAIDLAKKFHVFYDKCRVIDEDNQELTTARLELVRGTQIVLGIVMRDLLGIDTPERM